MGCRAKWAWTLVEPASPAITTGPRPEQPRGRERAVYWPKERIAMIIIWGSKTRRERLGTVADWCPACRSIQAISATQYFRVGHVYYISLGRGSLTATLRECWQCGSQYSCEEEDYDELLPEESVEQMSRSELVRQTNPYLEKRLQRQKQAQTEPGTPPDPGNQSSEVLDALPAADVTQGSRKRQPSAKKTNWLPCAGCAFILVVGIFMTILGFWVMGRYAEQEKRVGSEPGIPITATKLSKAFHENDQSAKENYQTKVILVSGKVNDIKGKKVVLDVPFPLAPVYCEVSDKFRTDVRSLKKGQDVTIKGYCEGSGFLSIDLKYCQIQK
jgi:hypothetical protein